MFSKIYNHFFPHQEDYPPCFVCSEGQTQPQILKVRSLAPELAAMTSLVGLACVAGSGYVLA